MRTRTRRRPRSPSRRRTYQRSRGRSRARAYPRGRSRARAYPRNRRRSRARTSAILLIGFGLAVAVRVGVGGRDVAQDGRAGLVFAGFLLAMVAVRRIRLQLTRRSVLIGVAGGAFLCLPAVVGGLRGSQVLGAHRPGGSFLGWAVVVTIVAVAEEVFLRGALYDAIATWRDETSAIVITAIAFAALHIPLYGWHVVPLDLAVGLWLGALRHVSHGPTAPAVAHTTADLVGWWLR